MPPIEEHAFWIRRDQTEVKELRDFLLQKGWLEKWSSDEYDQIQNDQDMIIYDNRRDYADEYWDKKRYEESKQKRAK